MYIKKHCSPSSEGIGGSCIPRRILMKIATILNKHENCKINKRCSVKVLQKNIKKEIDKLTQCSNEYCWEFMETIKEKLPPNEYEILQESFKPLMPEKWKKNPNTWLNTNDIDNVLEQYEDEYPYFKYYGASPIDFDLKTHNNQCKVNDLCNINIKELLDDNVKCIGMVFNVDPHTKGGQHWFSMYVDLVGMNRKKKPTIYYFDSISTSITSNEIKNLIEKLQSQAIDNQFTLDLIYNDKNHQKENTECGVYCLHFLTNMLQGTKFKQYLRKPLRDKDMEKYREIFFIRNENNNVTL